MDIEKYPNSTKQNTHKSYRPRCKPFYTLRTPCLACITVMHRFRISFASLWILYYHTNMLVQYNMNNQGHLRETPRKLPEVPG
jgi:hypothetical protein